MLLFSLGFYYKVYCLNITRDISGSNLMLELDSVLYVGGVPRDMYNSLPVGVLSRQGFEGCMASLDLPGESPSLMEDAVAPSSSLVSGCEGRFPPSPCTPRRQTRSDRSALSLQAPPSAPTTPVPTRACACSSGTRTCATATSRRSRDPRATTVRLPRLSVRAATFREGPY